MLPRISQTLSCGSRQKDALLLAGSLKCSPLIGRSLAGSPDGHVARSNAPDNNGINQFLSLAGHATRPHAIGCDVKSVRRLHTSPVTHEVELTSVRYPVRRGAYATLTDADVDAFIAILGKDRVVTDAADVAPHNVDWIKMVRGASKIVLRPRCTEEVSAILRHCSARRLAVCPQGGNTGLVGGSVPVFDEVIISMALMNKIISVDELAGVAVCEAGCILEVLEKHLNDLGMMMPLDLGAKGSCQIGGNVSTNAGGIRLLRYGSLQGSVLGIEAVTANGDVIDCLSTLKKDNTGYHLKHLFIGSEGTLGIVTKVAIQCPISPKTVNVAFLGLNRFEDVLATFRLAKHSLGEILSSCEMMDLSSLQAATLNLNLRCPLGDHPFYMLVETSGSDAAHDQAKLDAFLEAAMGAGHVVDGTAVSEPSRIKCLWEIRERIPEGLMADGHFMMWDVSLPLAHFYSIVPLMCDRVANTAAIRCCGFGHLGDGNLHLNVTSKEFDHSLLDLIEPFVYEWTSNLRGSVSAEHGIGFKKTQFIHFSKSASSLALMGDIKKLMDPLGILNPYKVLPQ